MWIFVNDSLFITNSYSEEKKGKKNLPWQMFASLARGECPRKVLESSLLTACKNQNPGLGSLWGTPCPLAVNFGKGHHGLLLRNPAAKSRRGREKRWGEKGFDSGNYDLLTSFFTPLIICLTVDTTLIIDGQVGPAKNRATAGICGCGKPDSESSAPPCVSPAPQVLLPELAVPSVSVFQMLSEQEDSISWPNSPST